MGRAQLQKCGDCVPVSAGALAERAASCVAVRRRQFLQGKRSSATEQQDASRKMAEMFEMYLAISDATIDAADQRKEMHRIVQAHRDSVGYGADGPTESQLLVRQRYLDFFGRSDGGRRKVK